jgi:DNA-directed RNA polymerase I subunit RPA2
MSSPAKSKKSKKPVKTAIKETCPSFCRGHLPYEENVKRLQLLSKPHVESFDYFLEIGLKKAIADIAPSELDLVDPKQNETVDLNEVSTLQFWVENVKVSPPIKSDGAGRGSRLAPRECRELGLMYSGKMQGDFCYQITQRRNGVRIPGRVIRFQKQFGDMPIMVMSTACHLRGRSPSELAKMREEHNEFGGYFLVNGIERCVRLLQIPRRNHPTAIQRSNYKNRGATYTDLGVAIRCSRYCGDQSSMTNTVHYLTTGGASLKFVARKQEFLIPVILIVRALSGAESEMAHADAAAGGGSIGITDEELYRRIVQGDEGNTFLRARAELLLQDARARFGNLNTPDECLAYLGARFRGLSQRAESTSNIEVGHYMIRR